MSWIFFSTSASVASGRLLVMIASCETELGNNLLKSTLRTFFNPRSYLFSRDRPSSPIFNYLKGSPGREDRLSLGGPFCRKGVVVVNAITNGLAVGRQVPPFDAKSCIFRGCKVASEPAKRSAL